MSEARQRIVGRRTRRVTTSSVLRGRRTGGRIVEKGKERKIIPIRDGDSIIIDLMNKVPKDVNRFRNGEYLHVSDLINKCARKIALSEKLGMAMPSERTMDSMALVYAQGHAIHDYVKGKFVRGYPDNIYGTWSCGCGETRTDPMVKTGVPKIHCEQCGGLSVNYNELELRDDDLMIVGSPDVVLYLDEYQVYYPLEIKSINNDDWKEIARPKPDHIIQVLFYWYLMRKLGYSVPSQVSVLYVNKGFVFKSPFKEFIIYPEDNLHRLDDYIEEARLLKEARQGGELPARSECSSPQCKSAKECHVAVPCFAM
jgi:CRISPR/Cas system-associated exonuclease Cas4 (RecB family)